MQSDAHPSASLPRSLILLLPFVACIYVDVDADARRCRVETTYVDALHLRRLHLHQRQRKCRPMQSRSRRCQRRCRWFASALAPICICVDTGVDAGQCKAEAIDLEHSDTAMHLRRRRHHPRPLPPLSLAHLPPSHSLLFLLQRGSTSASARRKAFASPLADAHVEQCRHTYKAATTEMPCLRR